MSRRFLLDTNTLSEPMRRRPEARVLSRLREHEAVIAIAAPVWHELVFGAQLLPPSRKRTRIEEYLSQVVRPSFPILAYDEQASEQHARERARLQGLGTPAPFVDGQIAAIAKVHGLVLVTSNGKDFERFSDLLLEDWREPT